MRGDGSHNIPNSHAKVNIQNLSQSLRFDRRFVRKIEKCATVENSLTLQTAKPKSHNDTSLKLALVARQGFT